MDLITHVKALPTDTLMDYSNFCNGIWIDTLQVMLVQNALVSIKGKADECHLLSVIGASSKTLTDIP